MKRKTTWYVVDLGTYTVSFDDLKEAERYVDNHFKLKGVVLGITTKED